MRGRRARGAARSYPANRIDSHVKSQYHLIKISHTGPRYTRHSRHLTLWLAVFVSVRVFDSSTVWQMRRLRSDRRALKPCCHGREDSEDAFSFYCNNSVS